MLRKLAHEWNVWPSILHILHRECGVWLRLDANDTLLGLARTMCVMCVSWMIRIDDSPTGTWLISLGWSEKTA